MHEIVTLQIGQQANYLATHFWNTQESYFTYSGQEESPVNHDIHFRQGISADGTDTYTPRTVIYDFKAAFGTLRKINELYEVLGDDQHQSPTNAWNGNIIIETQPLVPQTPYLNSLSSGLDPPALTPSNVRYWSDFNRVYQHPRSIVQVYETDVNPQQRSFDNWAVGEELFKELDREHDLFDRDVRPFVEECDQMQGLQMLTGVENGWGGFAKGYLDTLRDEFGKGAIWVWGLGEAPAETSPRRASKIVNEALAVHELSPQATLYIPLSGSPSKLPPYIALHRKLPWHTSALQATAYESLTLLSRLRASRGTGVASMDELAAVISPSGDRRIAQLQFEIAGTNDPAQNTPCDLFPEARDRCESQRSKTFSEIETFRGDPSKAALEVDENGRHNESMEEVDFRRFQSQLQFPILDSFPSIYSLAVPGQKSIAVRTRLTATSSIGSWVKSLERASRYRVSLEEREGLSNGLEEIREAYSTGRDSDDEDWDEAD